MTGEASSSDPNRNDVKRQLDALLTSSVFSASPKMRELLRHLVLASLDGDGERLKGYSIGVDVFERDDSFDPGTDSIVRVQVGRLRKLLEQHYAGPGREDPLLFDIPKGGNVVEFTVTSPSSEAVGGAVAQADSAPEAGPERGSIEPAPHESRLAAGAGDMAASGENVADSAGLRPRPPWASPVALTAVALAAVIAIGVTVVIDRLRAPPPTSSAHDVSFLSDSITVAVLGFANASGQPDENDLANGLTDGLTAALARAKALSVVALVSPLQGDQIADPKLLGAHYLIDGGVQRAGDRLRVNVRLIDAMSGTHVWGESYDRRVDEFFSLQDELVGAVARDVRLHLYIAAKRELSTRAADVATAWELYMRSTWAPGETTDSLAWEQERVALARRAVELDPDLGQAHSVLADKLSLLANIDPPSDTQEAAELGRFHARRAMALAPDDADVVFNVSSHHWRAGRIEQALVTARRTLELNPHHLVAQFVVDVAPYTCDAAPQSVMDSLIAFDTALSPDNPARWSTHYWMALLHLNRGELQSAATAARFSMQIFQTPDMFLAYAAALTRLGKRDEAIELVRNQRPLWPNMDPRHYAEAAISRRCGASPKAPFIRALYRDFAAAFEAADQ